MNGTQNELDWGHLTLLAPGLCVNFQLSINSHQKIQGSGGWKGFKTQNTTARFV